MHDAMISISDMKTFDLAVQSRNSDLVECLKPAALSLACHKGDVNRVRSLINKYNCDPKGLCVVDMCTCLVMGLWFKCLSLVKCDIQCTGFIAC